jgi:ring-1,2-phenylacetyl-CoA epoxidase subunit PaaD
VTPVTAQRRAHGDPARPASGRDVAAVRALLEDVRDPEIPVLTIADLGVLRDVGWHDARLTVTITPTYSGCPAMSTIEADIRQVLHRAGVDDFEIKTQFSPAWTTDWLSREARQKLLAIGIAPPVGGSTDKHSLLGLARMVGCPQCGSTNTELVSEFGSTACKALYRCRDCLEPFDYFKCI